MEKPIIIIGAGGNARVTLDILLSNRKKILAFTAKGTEEKDICGIPVINDESVIADFKPEDVSLVNGIGSVASLDLRRYVFEKFKQYGFSFVSVVHPSALIASDVSIGEGTCIGAGVIIECGAHIRENTIINTKVSVGHDSIIASHVHIAPGCTLCGNVSVGSCTHIGADTCVIQGIRIGKKTLIGAGSVVVKDIPDGVKAFGNPARIQDVYADKVI